MNYPKGLTRITSTVARHLSYEKWLKDDLDQLISALDISELHKHSLRSRWLDQVLWLEKKASRCQRWYYILRLIAIMGGVIVPTLVGLNLANNQFAAGFIQWTTFGLSMIVAISVATEEFFHFGERWRHYRSTSERLKIEGWQFFQLAGPYQNFKDHKEAYSSFATRTESIHQQEVDVYISEVVKEKKKEEDKNPEGANK
jgi:Protein of unknown function (DUF4231)